MDSADRRFMRRALSLARKGVGLASPNPAVGCVLVQGGRIVGEGWHEYDRLDHAEIRALREAGGQSRGATAYITLEPCAHRGRTPPCAPALVKAGIGRVVAATMDPNPQVAGKGFEILRRAGLSVEEVEDGLLRDHARRIIEAFACHVTTRRPLVTAKVGMSLDGRIGTLNGNDRWITSHASGEFSQKLRLESDALLVGIGTVLADDPQLTYRGPAAKRRGLIRVVLDSRLRTPPTARLFESTPSAPVLIFCGSDAPDTRRRRLEKKGAEIITVPSLKRGLDARRILLELGKRNVLGLLVEGGSEIHWYFLSHQLTDKFYFIIAPVVLGGKCSVPSVGGEGYGSIGQAPRFAVRSQFRMGPDVILETYPSYSKSILSPWLPSETAPFPEPDPLPALRKK